MTYVGACGIYCDVCTLHKKLGCVCSSGVEETAKEKVRTRWNGRGILCIVLDCAVKRDVAYCMRDCEELPCKKYFEWLFPYGEAYLEMHIKRRTHQEKEEKEQKKRKQKYQSKNVD